MGRPMRVGNQLPILLISFVCAMHIADRGWESVTNPLDKLYVVYACVVPMLGISYQSS